MSIAYQQNRKKRRARLHYLEAALFGTVPQNFQAAAQEIGAVKFALAALANRNFIGRFKWLLLGR